MFRKDLREHGIALLLLILMVLSFDAMVLLLIERTGFTVSRLDGIRLVHLFALPLVQLTLGNLLIVREYARGSAIWLDSLPMRPSTPVLTKYLFGALASAMASLAITVPFVSLSWHADMLDPVFLNLLLARTLGWTLLSWSLVFCISYFGSLRYLLYVLILGALLLASNSASIDHTRLAPFALMGAERFAYDRSAIPAWALWQAVAVSAALLLVVLLLTRGRRRSLIERLAQPLGRSGWFMLIALILVLLTVGTVLQRQSAPNPVVEAGDYVLVHREPDITVHIGDEAFRTLGQSRLDHLADWLPRLQTVLVEKQLPPVLVVFDTQLEEGELRLQGQAEAGIAINPRFFDADTALLMDVAIVHELLSQFSQGRGDFEPYHWLLDGAAWWLQQTYAAEPPEAHRERLLGLAVLTARRLVSVPDLSADWQRLADRHGYAALGALAWSLVSYLDDTRGTDRLLRLLRETQLTPAPNSLAAVLGYLHTPFVSRFEGIYGTSWQATLSGWWAWLDTRRVPAWVDAMPAATVSARLQTEASGDEQLTASLRWSGAVPDRVSDLQCRLGYSQVGPFDYETYWPEKRSEPLDCSESLELTLDGPFRPGARLYVTLEAESAQLIEPLRLYTTRLPVPR